MKRKACYAVFFYILLMLSSVSVVTAQQTFTANPSSVSFTINTKSLYTNGTDVSFAGQIKLKNAALLDLLGQNVNLDVKATTPTLNNGSYSIPLNQIKIKVTHIEAKGILLPILGSAVTVGTTQGGPYSPITLSTGSQSLTPGFTSSLLSGALGLVKLTIIADVKYTVIGGADLLKPDGNYTTGLTFSINAAGLLQSPPPPTSVNLTLNLTNISTITLGGGASSATLSFTTPLDYKNGVHLSQSMALQVFSNRSYQVSVKATGNLKNGTNTINIGNVRLTPAPNPMGPGISVSAIQLSQTVQNIITASNPTLNQYFDLKYFTQALNTAFINKPPGTYTTTLTYTITAP